MMVSGLSNPSIKLLSIPDHRPPVQALCQPPLPSFLQPKKTPRLKKPTSIAIKSDKLAYKSTVAQTTSGLGPSKSKRICKVAPRWSRDLKIPALDASFSLECADASFEQMASPTEFQQINNSHFFPQKHHMEVERSTALGTSASRPVPPVSMDAPSDFKLASSQSTTDPARSSHLSAAQVGQMLDCFPHDRFSLQIIKSAFSVMQTQINEKIRALLVNWLLSVYSRLALRAQTFFIAIALADRYCSLKPVDRRSYQRLALACLLIAAKFEEVVPPKAAQLVRLCDGLLTQNELLETEAEVLQACSFAINEHTLYAFTELLSQRLAVPTQVNRVCSALLFSSLFDLRAAEFGLETLSRACLFLAAKIVQQRDLNSGGPNLEAFAGGFEGPEERLLREIMAGEFDFKCVRFIVFLIKNLERAGMFAIRKLFPPFTAEA